MASISTSKVALYRPSSLHIPLLAKLADRSFRTDTHTQLKYLIKGTSFAQDITPALESWISRPANKTRLIVATIDDQIAGWACWAFSGFEHPDDELPMLEKAEEGEDAAGDDEKEEAAHHGAPEAAARRDINKEALASIAQLEDLTNAEMTKFVQLLSPPGSTTMILVSIAVDPAHQGHGVGTALLSWGTQIADRVEVSSWVSSSHGGYQWFVKNGFQQVGRHELCLDDYASELRNPATENGKWGSYVWTWLKRNVNVRAKEKEKGVEGESDRKAKVEGKAIH